MRRVNQYLRGLPLPLYAAITGLTVASTLLLVFYFAEAKPFGHSLGLAVACGIGSAIGSAIGRDRAPAWRRRLLGRLTGSTLRGADD